MTIQVKQLSIKVEVEMTNYLKPDRREWILPSGFKGENIVVSESKERYLNIEYLRRGKWD